MPRQLDIRAILTLAALFAVGDVWWCEDCGAGGFIPHRLWRHRRGCMFAQGAL